jgi:hypothetical protein
MTNDEIRMTKQMRGRPKWDRAGPLFRISSFELRDSFDGFEVSSFEFPRVATGEFDTPAKKAILPLAPDHPIRSSALSFLFPPQAMSIG